mgnify:CR=1 FL=1
MICCTAGGIDPYFNPRSRTGSDFQGSLRPRLPGGFQSTLPNGERPGCIDNLFGIIRFQSTLPNGERPGTFTQGV